MEDERWMLNSQMGRIGRLRHRILEGLVADLDIPPSQHHVLMYLSMVRSISSQAQVAEQLHVSPACVARTLKALDADGYIRRSNDGRDGRKNEISITEKGEQMVRRSYAIFQRMDDVSYAGFAEEDFIRLSALLNRILDNLSQMEEKNKER